MRWELGARTGCFFGEQHRESDFYFYYQGEWETAQKEGHLHRSDTVFLRDQKKKIYVQHRMLEQGRRLWHWLEEVAYFYVCGYA